MDKTKVKVWMDVPFPLDPTAVKSFIGCDGYYQRFIKNFAKIAISLT